MPLDPGTALGPYRIDAPIGAGGMGEVYRATDTRLDRTVAIKVLPAELASDPERRERFEREARTISSLQHPHICTLYDVGHQDGIDFLVMEHLDGETLQDRLTKGALPLDQALRYAIEIADALDKAHRQGIVHRDLKPGNVILTGEGSKLLDFGLAKALGGVDAIESSLTSAGQTEPGTVVGTPAYMSPEQLEGRSVDHRTDIFSLGVLLYEMVTGRRPFGGDSFVAQASSILRDVPRAVSELRPDSPARLTRIIMRCLQKDPQERLASARDLRRELGEVDADLSRLALGVTSKVSTGSGWRTALLGTVALTILVWTAWFFRSSTLAPTDGPALSIAPLTNQAGLSLSASWSPDGSQVAYDYTWDGTMDVAVMSLGGGDSRLVAGGPNDDMMPRWSPDGTKIAFLSDDGTGQAIYWVPPTGGLRRKLAETGYLYLDRFTSTRVIGAQPWSPDGRHLVFSRLDASGTVGLWRVDASTGEETRLTHSVDMADFGAAWSHEGEWIVFERATLGGASDLYRMPATGGEPEVVLANEQPNRTATWSLDGRRVLFVAHSDYFGGDVWDVDVDSGATRQLTVGAGASTPILSTTGRIAYSRWAHETFFFRMVPGSAAEHEQISLSAGSNFGQRFSPDGRSIVFQSARSGSSQIWLHDVESGAERQLTSPPAGVEDRTPDWSPDGTEIVFLSNREGPFQLWMMNAEGGALRRLSDQPIPMDGDWWVNARVAPRWSRDGRTIAYLAPGDRDSTLWLIDPDGGNTRQTSVTEVLRFDWYDDGRQVLYTRRLADGAGGIEMVAADLQSGEETLLLEANATELSVAPGGQWVAYNSADGHFSMNTYRLALRPPSGPAALPIPVGEPEQITFGEGVWHVHGGAWTPDGASLVYTRDFDSGNLHVIDNYR